MSTGHCTLSPSLHFTCRTSCSSAPDGYLDFSLLAKLELLMFILSVLGPLKVCLESFAFFLLRCFPWHCFRLQYSLPYIFPQLIHSIRSEHFFPWTLRKCFLTDAGAKFYNIFKIGLNYFNLQNDKSRLDKWPDRLLCKQCLFFHHLAKTQPGFFLLLLKTFHHLNTQTQSSRYRSHYQWDFRVLLDWFRYTYVYRLENTACHILYTWCEQNTVNCGCFACVSKHTMRTIPKPCKFITWNIYPFNLPHYMTLPDRLLFRLLYTRHNIRLIRIELFCHQL